MKELMTAAFALSALSALFATSGNPVQAASATQSTCTGLKLACLQRFPVNPNRKGIHSESRMSESSRY